MKPATDPATQFEARDALLEKLVAAVTGKATSAVTDQITALEAALARLDKDAAVTPSPAEDSATDASPAVVLTPQQARAEYARLQMTGDARAAGKFYVLNRTLILGR